jgi:hypothetical protein
MNANAAAFLLLFASLTSCAATETKPTTPSAAERMQQSGPEEQQLKRRMGTWTVKATFRPTPDAKPIVTEQLIAERKMVGLYMEETMHPDAGAKMPACSFANESDGKLTLVFESLAFVGLGQEAGGRMIRSNLEISRESNDHEFVRQYWVQSDGTARQWPAVEYEYTRRR